MRFMVCLPLCFITLNLVADTLPLLKDGDVPESVSELWQDYDSSREPLDSRVVREWKADGVVCQYITYTIGTFKGQKATMAAFYAFPEKREGEIPGLIQMHGGGQRASVASAKFGAQNGYATLSINWGGREMENAEPGDPTTDWGAVDATQAGHNSHYSSLMPDEKTIDSVESPRNSNWFLIVLAAKRGITFLQMQPQVNEDRIGAFGHSMGGKLTTMLAGADERIKAGVPSCGGSGAAPDSVRNRPGAGVRPRKSDLYHKTIDDVRYIERIDSPMLYMGPQNDFNGILDNMYANWSKMPSNTVGYTVSPHMNHRSIAEHVLPNLLWFDAHLKGTFDFPDTPNLSVTIQDRVPMVRLSAEHADEVAKVVIYYSQDTHILTRFWHAVPTSKIGDQWLATLTEVSRDRPLFVMANVYYPLNHKLVGYPWMREMPTTFGVSSEMKNITPSELAKANVAIRVDQRRMIQEVFDYRDWYRLNWGNPTWWSAYTRKIKSPMYRGPEGATLKFDVRIENDITIFLELQDNNWGAFPGHSKGTYYTSIAVKGAADWQTVEVSISDFKPVDARTTVPLKSWRHVTELGICGRIRVVADGNDLEPVDSWKAPRDFRNLRWHGGTYPPQ